MLKGCGRKRSDDSMAALVVMNEDPIIEDLNRHFSSEAKLWEAIQEAHLDNLSRKQKAQVCNSLYFFKYQENKIK